jgi:mono/diheme cytochrome c family protein
MIRFFFRASAIFGRAPFALAAGALICAAPGLALADEPGGVTRTPPPVTGEQVYTQVCQSCHMANAMGGSGAAVIPALANNPRLSLAAYPIVTVLKGRGVMPWFDDTLTPAQVAAVVTYVRTHFGNHYDKPVTEADVLKLAGTKTPP